MLIYFAGPLFSEAERAFNARLAAQLEERGFDVFLPQRDGFEIISSQESELSISEQQEAIFAFDRDRILAADVFLFVLDGRVPDEGACVELGIAYAQKSLEKRSRLLIGLLTDRRAAFLDAKLNAMVQGALDTIVDNEEDLLAAVAAADHARR